jgi:hypothetical protein
VHVLHRVLGSALAVTGLAALTACNGSLGQNAAPTARDTSAAALAFSMRGALPVRRRVAPKRAWLSSAAKKSAALLYVADNGYYPGVVDLYDYKSGTLLGQSAGIGAGGMCSDEDGNAYVTDFVSGAVYEIQHGTTTVIGSWYTNGEPIGCSVNPRNGDLAITNFYDFGSPSSTGSVEVYAAGGQSATTYYGPGYDWPAGYDKHGNLFVAASYAGQCTSPCLAELAAGGAWSVLNVSGAQIYFPAAVEWDGKYLGVGDQEVNGTYNFGIYRMSLHKGRATVVGTVLPASGCGGYLDLVQWAYYARKPSDLPVKHASQMAGPSGCGSGGSVSKWSYPAGANPIGSIGSGGAGGLTIVSR